MKTKAKLIELENTKIIDCTNEEVKFENLTQTFDYIADQSYQFDVTTLMFNEEQLEDDFFNLSNRKCGELFQKCKNYNIKLVITGDYAKYNSNALLDFVYECNNGNDFILASSIEEAISLAQGKH